jgi:ribonuclease HII
MGTGLRHFENRALEKGFARIAGIDEAGRGPLAGPVVAAAVILPPAFEADGVDDSKRLSPSRRGALYDRLYAEAVAIGIGIVDAIEIDRINILRATLLAMTLAVGRLRPPPDLLLVDGTCTLPLALEQRAIPGGDHRSVSVAAASVVAKVTRDRLMQRYHEDYPQYGFARHKGYPTREHKRAIARHGRCPIHRRTFKGVVEPVDPLFR